MNTRWMNTYVATAAQMLDVTDEMILEFSNGEVTLPAPNSEEEPVEGSTNDPTIFGSINEEAALMGHITLSLPIVNIQYLFGSRPILPRILGISRKDIEKIIYYSYYVVIDPKGSDATYKKIMDEKEGAAFLEAYPDATCLTGAKAIDALLEKEGAVEREHIILHNIPVIPISLRYRKVECQEYGDAWRPFSLQYLYDRFILHRNRLERLRELNAPEIIIMNEGRMLQEYADTLVSNGARGIPYIMATGYPAQSLQEFYEAISRMPHAEEKPLTPTCDNVNIEKLEPLLCVLYPDTTEEDDGDTIIPDIDGIDEEPFDPENDPVERAEKEILALFNPYIKAVIESNFSAYVEDYFEVMKQFAEDSILCGLKTVNLEKPIEPQLIGGIFDTIQLAMKKQSIYL